MDSRQCQAATKVGAACKGRALPDSDFCLFHDPEKASQRAEWTVQGGHARSNERRARKQLRKVGLRSFDDLDAALNVTLTDLLDGKIEAGVATAAATIARSIISIRQAADLDARIERLEATLDRTGHP